MNKKKIIIIFRGDIIDFPPIISLINVLSNLRITVHLLSFYSDEINLEKLKRKGIRYNKCFYNPEGHIIDKLSQTIIFKQEVKKYLIKEYDNDTFVWIIGTETMCVLEKIIPRFKTILHLLEFVTPKINIRYKIFSPFFDMRKALQSAYRIVCCEYNRAQITKGLFNLETLPTVLPNKLYLDEEIEKEIPLEIKAIVEDIKYKTKGKKILLYQGIFLSEERRLEEFIQAVSELPDNYCLLAMGKGSEMYEKLRKKYSSNKIIFIDFIKPPYHLLITQLASIGIVSYFPRAKNFATVINPLYCAPNKTFEYTRFSIPMISNDVPALKFDFEKYHCGRIISYPINKNKIKEAIDLIFCNYDAYSKGAEAYYNSVNITDIVSELIEFKPF